MMNAARLALALVALAAAPVAAQPGADYPPPPPQGQPDVIVIQPQQQPPPVVLPQTLPPHNEPWENVSHINGQIVKVGERGEYLIKNKKTNIASNPIGWMIGFYGLSISHAVHNNVAIRGDINFIDLRESNTSGYEIGASLPIYFKRVFHGPFMEPGLIVRSWDDGDDYCDLGCDNAASVGPSLVFGWHWTFDSGLNVAAAFGIMRNLAKQSMDDYDTDIEPSGYFRVGYAF